MSGRNKKTERELREAGQSCGVSLQLCVACNEFQKCIAPAWLSIAVPSYSRCQPGTYVIIYLFANILCSDLLRYAVFRDIVHGSMPPGR